MSYGSVMGQSQDTSKIEQDIVNLQNDYVPKSGATMTGELNMGNNKISGVADGVEATDVATVGQLDSAGWYPFKGSGLTLVGHFTGYRKKGNISLRLDLDKAYSKLYVYTFIVDNYDISLASMTQLTQSSNENIYGINSNSVLFQVGNISLSAKGTSLHLSSNYDCYYEIYAYTV